MELNKDTSIIRNRTGMMALSPVIIFLIFYLVISIVIGDFYKMPISIAFIIASTWAIITTPHKKISERIDIFSKGAANLNILLMIWIFILAGSFASLAKGIGAIDATVNFTLAIMPPQFLIPGLFIAACFISMSIGTSVGTVVALTPFAIQLAQSTGENTPFFVAVVLGGSFFGDNLSFISDTTIAATRSQGCKMSDKFKANIWITGPAAIATLIIYFIEGSTGATGMTIHATSSSFWLVVPYLIVIITAMIGINVLVVLLLGIISSIIIGMCCTNISLIAMCGLMGDGTLSMGELIIVTLLAGGMLEVVRHNGGISYIIQKLTKHIHGSRGAQACISLVVGIVNVCTANNTIAIITVGNLSKQIADKFNLDPRKVASLLDTSSCIVQCIIPYGAQTLLAAGLAKVSPIAFQPFIYFPWILAAMVALSIIFRFPRSYQIKQ
ncbi:MAG: Na+/H+ antiporter NhaC family protein [Muribaculaceae bacterium]|jgi:Na+/H+ antiporter NhaC|nr:Na+/H+ antiporter NhaC family protein [Muribaculaceae bacterium]